MTTPQTAYIHSWTVDKLLKGAGPGADPTEIDVPTKLAFTELLTANHQPVAVNTWEDWDISALVPVGTKYVLAQIYKDETLGGQNGVRANGSALARFSFNWDTHKYEETWEVEVDGNRIIEIYGCENTVHVHFRLIGYWA